MRSGAEDPAGPVAPAAEERGLEPITIRELTARIQAALDSDPFFRRVVVIGEISNFKRHSSGHIYFTLKDGAEAQINCVFFKGANRGLSFEPKDGLEVVVHGEIKIYPPYGSYQLYVRRMIPGGLGLYYAKYEEIKRKLVAEGLTDKSRKRALPGFPRRIGIVASRDSAGLRDVIKVLERRYPLAEVVLAPVNVEGEGCAPSVVGGLRLMAESGRADVVIVCRGGGSIESLWGFNTEIVARAIAAMPVPVITAIGHETDTTIADLVADRRAATPTEAAELATPSIAELSVAAAGAIVRSRRSVLKRLEDLRGRLLFMARTLRSPQSVIEYRIERIDRVGERILMTARSRLGTSERSLETVGSRLRFRSPWQRTREVEVSLAEIGTRLHNSASRALEHRERIVQLSRTRIEAANPTAILARGYAVPLHQGRAIRSAEDLRIGDQLELRLHRGAVLCEVKGQWEEERG